MANLEQPPEAKLPASDASIGLRIAATVLRVVFIIALVVLTLRVSMPQNETIWTAYDTPSDLVRLILGVVVCVWLLIQLFFAPKDVHAYRTWLYLGLVAVPFVLICLVAVW
jgi:TRAP-type C4-dicarboxylate transport system permease small subunit